MISAATCRPPAVAASFYPGEADALRKELERCLGRGNSALRTGQIPKAIIVPHAGYVYSGVAAARAFELLAAHSAQIKRVVLLGPCHRVAVHGLALPDVAAISAFATPLGRIPLDLEALQTIKGLPHVVVSDAAHAQEHSLEVQLPFLQVTLGDFKLVPLAVGDASTNDVATVLEALWGGPETLIVISSDLSHFHTYHEAQVIDNATVAQILALKDLTSSAQACGARPINGVLEIARRRGLTIERLAQINSGDTAGDKARVVGYASFALYEAAGQQLPELGKALLGLARNAIATQLGSSGQAIIDPSPFPELAVPGATFVTLTLDGRLRGCIGSLEAHRSLLDDVQANAVAAAFRDPRFPPVSVEEFVRLKVEVSLLAKPVPLQFASEADALRQLRPGIDGVILVSGLHRSTFLPQVWEQLPEPRQFLAHLKQKAGLPADAWPAEMRLFRYEVQKWK